MTPSAIVLNVCAVIFSTLALIFFSYLLNRFRMTRKQQLITIEEAKQIPMYDEELSPVLHASPKYRLAEAE